MKTWMKVLLGLLILAVLAAGGICAYMFYALGRVDFGEFKREFFEESFEEDEDDGTLATASSDAINWQTVESLADTEGVYNILLCGMENQHKKDGAQGRADSVMIASVNMNTRAMSLISLMRDEYVQIEGYSNNKLNAAYRIGGMPLLKDTVEKNFGVPLDGCVVVSFDQFEEVIDLLGGVEIQLTEDEFYYMQMKEVIDMEEDVTEWTSAPVRLDGAQALWYSRIRYVKTDNNLRDDYGRTYRQRKVLTELYREYKDTDYFTLLGIVPDLLGMISTDLSQAEFLQLGVDVLSLKDVEIRQTSCPFKGTYHGTRINGMSVQYLDDIGQIRVKIQKIIEGEEIETVLNTYYEVPENLTDGYVPDANGNVLDASGNAM